MVDSFSLAEAAAEHLRQATPLRPRVAVVLGSGLGPWADALTEATRIPFDALPGFHTGTVAGHSSEVVVGNLAGRAVLAFAGRVHAYEGHDLQTVVHPVRMAARFGVNTLLLTNAAGSLSTEMPAGSLMLIRDHINLTGRNVLCGPNDERWGPRFPDMTDAWTPALRRLALEIAHKEAITLHEGVYTGVLGPTYETPAEVRMFGALGGHAVGMSTVHEAIAARHAGMRLLGISCITNLGAGLGHETLTHEDVQDTAASVQSTFRQLVSAILTQIDVEGPPA